jgi:hypothetical protein
MSETPETTAVAVQDPATYQLVAVDQGQLNAAHQKMIAWASERQATCAADLAEREEALRIAERRQWDTSALKRRISELQKRHTFYAKIEAALRAGYAIVPNFEMDVFAIRTTRRVPPGGWTPVGSWENREFRQEPMLLPAGEGEYKNPLPDTQRTIEQSKDEKGNAVQKHYQMPTEFTDIEFPIALAKPVLMEATQHAMALQVFDEIGVAVDSGRERWRGNRRGDPIILGRIRNPRKNHPDISLFLGWYFDPSNL